MSISNSSRARISPGALWPPFGSPPAAAEEVAARRPRPRLPRARACARTRTCARTCPAPHRRLHPAPARARSAAPAPTPITGLTQQALPNASYSVAATTTGTVVITLPASAQIQPGQTVSVTGTSANNWQIAQNAGQTVLTTGMAGNVLPAANWTARDCTPKPWHWVSSNAAGNVLVAGEGAGGNLHTSVDGGTTWTPGNSPSNDLTWISSDMSASGDRIVAVQYEGGMYMSIDRGTTWTQSPVPSRAST